MADAPVIKRTRARVPRVRTGCITCKKRHLKCDEEKPSCRQCISAGFKCDGYKPPQPAKPRETVATSTSVEVVAPLAAQKRLLPNPGCYELKLYQRYVAPKLSSYSDAGFWNVLIPQMSQTEPAIQHVVVAICAVHRDIESIRSYSQLSVLRPNPLAMKEASQAMQSLSQRIKSDPCSSLVPLVACLLFTCLELLCGNFETAIVHVANGFRILNSPGSTELAGRSHQQIADMNTVDKEVAPVFQHLSVLCLLFGQTHAFDTYGHVATTEFATFTSLESARLNLFELFSQVFRFIKVASDKADKGSIDFADLIEKVKFERRLQHWYSCMEQYVKSAAKLGRHVNENAVYILRLHHRTILVWLSVCLSVDGVDLNLHTSNFEEIVRLCESLARDSPSKRNSPGSTTTSPPQTAGYNKFSFGMGMIPSLYWVARECRDSTIRKKALDLLLRAPLHESLWDVHVFYKIFERAKAIEKSRKHSQKMLSPEDCWRGDLSLASDHKILLELPVHNFRHVQTYRIHNCLIPNNWSSDQRSGVTFRAKPWGPLGAWHIWDDSVYL
ncbi:uncharacterized protein BDZ99DRAFT_397267 [Mytilinidion resinicola]|uniref:Zn(2)-C6 fungal-type domain-containing protein n=1 Tax=Mytilinidion resinicola TaxID=574789 RepID=A0A6A6YA91_9PEZI|nr:uncharacterized protein BDZ99DRAFT_397267 [Mytilinidion resinicola]KAF2804914.1 hypothetical protein BDZ99DRAFT_397267 [Mytilinidion resinicola]